MTLRQAEQYLKERGYDAKYDNIRMAATTYKTLKIRRVDGGIRVTETDLIEWQNKRMQERDSLLKSFGYTIEDSKYVCPECGAKVSRQWAYNHSCFRTWKQGETEAT